MKEFYLEILAPMKPVFKGQVSSVVVPGTNGEFQVLFNHAPLISSLTAGRLILRINDNNEIYSVSGGSIEISDNKVLVLVDSIEKASEIDVIRARKSAERAKERLSPSNRDKFDSTRAEASLTRAINRIKIANQYKS